MDVPVPVPARAPVLVVDNDATIRAAERAVLEDDGYAVAEAETAREALDFLRAAAAGHVVLLDYLMPQNGGAVLRAVEGDAGLRRHRYVLLTVAQTSHLPAHEQILINALCAEVVSKPFDVDDLLRAVATAAAQLPAHP